MTAAEAPEVAGAQEGAKLVEVIGAVQRKQDAEAGKADILRPFGHRKAAEVEMLGPVAQRCRLALRHFEQLHPVGEEEAAMVRHDLEGQIGVRPQRMAAVVVDTAVGVVVQPLKLARQRRAAWPVRLLCQRPRQVWHRCGRKGRGEQCTILDGLRHATDVRQHGGGAAQRRGEKLAALHGRHLSRALSGTAQPAGRPAPHGAPDNVSAVVPGWREWFAWRGSESVCGGRFRSAAFQRMAGVTVSPWRNCGARVASFSREDFALTDRGDSSGARFLRSAAERPVRRHADFGVRHGPALAVLIEEDDPHKMRFRAVID